MCFIFVFEVWRGPKVVNPQSRAAGKIQALWVGNIHWCGDRALHVNASIFQSLFGVVVQTELWNFPHAKRQRLVDQ